MKGTFWKEHPVYPNPETKPFDYIGTIPPPLKEDGFKIYKLTDKYIDQTLDFINANYIGGYVLSKDYFMRKITIVNSYSFVLVQVTEEETVVKGFIYSQPIFVRGHNGHYVDLLAVDHRYRGSGLAKALIHCVSNFSGSSKFFLHKKDENPLPFPYFSESRHYTGIVRMLKDKYTNYKPVPYKFTTDSKTTREVYDLFVSSNMNVRKEMGILIDRNIFMTSESVKSCLIREDSCFCFFILKYKANFTEYLVAEVFFVNENFNEDDYAQMLSVLDDLNVNFLVVLPVGFFKKQIEIDNYRASQKLYLHSYNMHIPLQEDAFIPLF